MALSPDKMILLDTHVVIWLMTNPGRISTVAADAISGSSNEGQRPGVSTATIFELMYATRRGRVQLHVSQEELLNRLRAWFDFYPITETIAAEAAALPEPFHGDPMDRIIAATAIAMDFTLITRDDRILEAKVCKTLW